MSSLRVGGVSLFSLAIAPIVSTSISFGDSQWTMFIGFALILLVAGIVVGRKMARGRRQYRSVEPASSAGDKLSGQLVALSSAAIIAVYGAGYFRTNAAARQFDEQSAQIRLTASATAALSSAASPAVKSATSISSAAVSQRAIVASAAQGLAESPPASKSATPSETANSTAGKPATTGSAEAGSHSGARAAGNKTAAAAASDQSPSSPAAPPSPYKDGTYAAWGSCPHGNLQATVVIASGLIVAADVTQCQTQYPCNMLDKLTNEVVYQQSPAVDVVTGATDSANAFHMAVTQALAQAVQALTQAK